MWGFLNPTKVAVSIYNMSKRIVAIVGMPGSGKTVVTKYLQNKHGWPNVYMGAPTFERMEVEGLEMNYENEKITREKIRAEMGMGAYAELCLPKIKKELEKSDVCLVESMYSWSEYKIYKDEFKDNFYCLAVFANPQIRFERLSIRTNERPMKSRQEFDRRDYTEIEGIEKGGPIARADFMAINESSKEKLFKQIDKFINKIL